MPSEFALIDRFFRRPVHHTILGVGDDGALLRPAPGMELAISTDMLVAGTHFLPDTDPEALGWKTLAVNVSDLAAMGAQPRWALLALALPEVDEAWLAAFARGLFDCADTFGIDLIGGDTTRGPLNLCVTLCGEVPAGQALRRSGARPGDDVWVSGQPGRASLGLACLQGRARLAPAYEADCLAALHRPQPRVALGLALRGLASAAIDISDGLLADLGHILEQSGVSATLHLACMPGAALAACADAQLARDCLLAGGDDYELLFTAPPTKRESIEAAGSAMGIGLIRIGEIGGAGADSLVLLDARGQSLAPGRRGYDHFSREREAGSALGVIAAGAADESR